MKYFSLLLILLIVTSLSAQKRMVSLDGAQLWVNTIGLDHQKTGQPVIVFESGLGTPMDNWDRVLDGVAAMAPLVTYDRPGIGKSETVDDLPTVQNVADRLVRLLEKLEAAPPYVLVGHSLGGLYVRGFANLYPELLAGLIIVDPADFTETHQNKRLYYDVLNWEASRVDSLIQSFIDRRKNWKPGAPIAIRREGEVLEAIREKEFKGVNDVPLPNIPVHILTGGRYEKPKKLRSKVYDEEALFRSKMKHRVHRWTNVIQSVDKGMLFYSGDAGHFVHYDDPELLISSVRIVLKDFEALVTKRNNEKKTSDN